MDVPDAASEQLTGDPEIAFAIADEHRREGQRLALAGDKEGAFARFTLALAAFPADVATLIALAELTEEHTDDRTQIKACWCAVMAIRPGDPVADARLRALYRDD